MLPDDASILLKRNYIDKCLEVLETEDKKNISKNIKNSINEFDYKKSYTQNKLKQSTNSNTGILKRTITKKQSKNGEFNEFVKDEPSGLNKYKKLSQIFNIDEEPKSKSDEECSL
eukprot:CAMPEP_0116892270 /NCGR_PEP_ID=MMETSP0467-20121206/2530_1 /TAXON_ID=283647 /ORGANISM="Mesodinium pulex, Strain SPMC105" /LENGTH=114 /DNA_ID=CAMNT_0004561305 /DNA_START=404 /DNA_END=748 /DNA_ORIENTATION=-